MTLFRADISKHGRHRSIVMKSCVFWAVFALMTCNTIQAEAQERSCRIADITRGPAVLIRADERLDTALGQTIQPGDRLVKSDAVQVSIICSDGGEITIGRASEVDLGSLIAAPVQERRIFRLLRGIAGFVKPDQAEPVEVKTMNAVAAVRSTEWTVEVDGDVTHVFVRKGVVQVTGDSGAVTRLEVGQGVTVMADGTLGPVTRWGQDRIEAMNARLGGGWL
jgi:ferric-dicitrate binding protein FerR (iron transport regulator)